YGFASLSRALMLAGINWIITLSNSQTGRAHAAATTTSSSGEHTMKGALLGLLIVVAIAGVVAYHNGWLNFEKTDNNGKGGVNISVDKEKAKQDLKADAEKLKELGKEGAEKVKEAGKAAAEKVGEAAEKAKEKITGTKPSS